MIVYRLVKGSPLTIAELDNNFHELEDGLLSFQSDQPEPRSIDEITAVGSTLVILYNDSTEDTVTFPVIALRGRGNWAPSTAYLVNDAVTANGFVYVVKFPHTSALTFDAGANDGMGHDFYGELFKIPELSLPPGGAPGYVLTQVGSELENQWTGAGFPADGIAGDIVFKLSEDPYDFEWRNAGSIAVASVLDIALTDLTISSLAYANTYIRCTADDGCDVTILADIDALDFPIGTEIHFRQCGAGGVRLIGQSNSDGDVILNSISGFVTQTQTLGAVITAKKVAVNEWDVWGLLESEGSDLSDSD